MIPKEVEQALEETGLPWEIEEGSRHRKIKVAGRLVGILPHKARGQGGRGQRNVIAQIRRAGK
jgi:hypothetical protein